MYSTIDTFFHREHPGLNWGHFDLQSNALPLSYTPLFICDLFYLGYQKLYNPTAGYIKMSLLLSRKFLFPDCARLLRPKNLTKNELFAFNILYRSFRCVFAFWVLYLYGKWVTIETRNRMAMYIQLMRWDLYVCAFFDLEYTN